MYVKNFDPKIKTCEIGAYINKLIRHCWLEKKTRLSDKI